MEDGYCERCEILEYDLDEVEENLRVALSFIKEKGLQAEYEEHLKRRGDA